MQGTYLMNVYFVFKVQKAFFSFRELTPSLIPSRRGHFSTGLSKKLVEMPGVLKDSSSRARALAGQRDTGISRNAFLGISFCFNKSAHSILFTVLDNHPESSESLSETVKSGDGQRPPPP